MKHPLGSHVALVTGAAGGLGSAICAALAARGARVVAADIDADRANALTEELRANGAQADALALDVTDRQAVDRVVADVVDRAGSMDVLVNLAGILRNQVLVKLDDEDFHTVMRTHLDGTLNTMRAGLPHMRERGYGRVVNMSSIAVRGSVAGGAYAAAKGAIEALTRAAAIESAKHGITANCVAPGLIDAGMFRSVPEDYQQASQARVPMGRAGSPAEVAACVAFLASAEASYVTGQTLFVCGGLSLGF